MGTDTGSEFLRRADVLLVQGEDPWQDPTGGIVSFTKCLLRAYGNRIAVASPSNADLPVGGWTRRPFEGRDMAFFNLGPLKLRRGEKPLVPAKIQVFSRVRRHMRALHDCGVRNLLIDSAEVLFSAQRFYWESVCYFFHGLFNPVSQSRYPWARILGRPYERRIVRALRRMKPDAIIAAADQTEVERFIEGPGRSLDRAVVHSFPTRVDRSVFFPEPRDAARAELGLDPDELILVASGRLSRTKGWRLLLETVRVLTGDSSAVHLIFVGDGEERSKIVSAAAASGMAPHVSITGFISQECVRTYLNAADVCVVASLAEGWSLAMLEELACARPLVSTDVSGATAMIRKGENGFIVSGREPERFAGAVREAAVLPQAAEVSSGIAAKYALDGLAEDFGRIWKPLSMVIAEDLDAIEKAQKPRGRGTADRR